MSEKKRHIIVREDDKIVYEGPDNRHYQSTAIIQTSKFFGLSPDTWVKIIGVMFLAGLFYVRTNEFMEAQIKLNDKLITFTQNSDAYHSAQTGQLFKQGMPTEWGRRRSNFNAVKPAYAGEHNQEEQ